MPQKQKKIVLLLCSFGFIFIFGPIYVVYYLTLISLVYTAGQMIKERPDWKKPIFLSTLLFLLFNLIFYKYFNAFFELLTKITSSFINLSTMQVPRIVLPLGLSFVTFRLLHYIIEINRDNIPSTSFIDFTLYCLFFPTFLAGPIERFPNFYNQTKNIARIDYDMVSYGLWRILLGLIKKFIIADMILNQPMCILNDPESFSRLAVISSMYGVMIRLYMDFSGYTDIAIGISRLFGYRIIENFNKPFLQSNIVSFWRNWHISFYAWIRDYFYLPLFVYRASLIKFYLGPFLTLMVFMLWHGSSIGFFLAGLINGVSWFVWIAFHNMLRNSLQLQNKLKSGIFKLLSIGLTFSLVSFSTSIFFFNRNLEQIKIILSKVFIG